jgi:acyl-CoA synthetase (AMP-forming)/AMP-acid ligase II/acyl carrier protein
MHHPSSNAANPFDFVLPRMATVESISEAIVRAGELWPQEVAILAPDRPPLRYLELAEQVARIGDTINGFGLGRGDRIVIEVPQGPELALAILGVAAYATAVPLDPSLKVYELQRYLSSISASALVTADDCESEAANLADRFGLDLIRLEPIPAGPAGTFRLSGQRTGHPERPGPGERRDIAILFTTSGTTGDPKIVPQRHANLLASANNFVRWYELSRDDRSVIVSPLFHNLALINGLLAPLLSGGSTVVPPRYDPDVFFEVVRAFDPTWYSAGPTFHASIVASAKECASVVENSRLRFIRSASAPLPPAVMTGLEQTFGAPVLEGWGMAETCSHATSNPLPPAVRKAGTVGLPVGFGVEVAVIDETGKPVAIGRRGEIIVRGPTVTSGYLDDPQANAAAFVDGWLRTGDLGFFDEEGYLTIAGRIDDIINRGGQKIAPYQVDRVLCGHPDVLEAACFPIKHRTLGQEVMAAVKLREGAKPTLSELTNHTARSLTAYKVPRRIVVVDEIPTSPNGKMLRSQLAATLGLKELASTADASRRCKDDARTSLERGLADLWKRSLSLDGLSIHDDFFILGGDSLQATRLLLEVNERFGVDLDAEAIFGPASTIAGMAQEIERRSGTRIKKRKPGSRARAHDREREPSNEDGEQRADLPDIDFVEFQVHHHVSSKAELYYIDESTGLRRIKPNVCFGPIRTNGLGFRSPEIETPKPEGTIRIAFLGSSTTFDTWVSGNEATWPHQTWLRIKEASPTRRIDYVNGAVPGYGTGKITLTFERFLSPLEPDVVVIAPSDINVDTAHRAREVGIYGGVHHRPSWLARRWRLWGRVEINLVIARRLPFAHSGRKKLHVDPRDVSSGFEERLERLVRLCQEKASVVVLLSARGRLRRGQSRWQQLRAAGTHVYYMPYMSIEGLLDVRDEYDRVVRSVAGRTGCVLLDVRDAVPSDGRHYVDSNHYSDAGSARLASAVSEALVSAEPFRELLASLLDSG